MANTLLEFVLARLDEIEAPTVLHSEVVGYGDELTDILSQGILREISDATEIPRPDSMQAGEDLLVRKTASGIFGVAPPGDYFDPVELSAEDIRQYKISVPKLAARLCRENGIHGRVAAKEDGLLWLGQKTLANGEKAEVYLCFPNYDTDQFWRRCEKFKRFGNVQSVVLLTPQLVPVLSERRQRLDEKGVALVSLTPSGNGVPLAVDWKNLCIKGLRETSSYDLDQNGNDAAPFGERFSFEPGQALFDGGDLDLPSGFCVGILQKLVGSFGRTVCHKQLHDMSNASEASPELRTSISTLRKKLKDRGVPCRIDSKRGEGYSIRIT